MSYHSGINRLERYYFVVHLYLSNRWSRDPDLDPVLDWAAWELDHLAHGKWWLHCLGLDRTIRLGKGHINLCDEVHPAPSLKRNIHYRVCSVTIWGNLERDHVLRWKGLSGPGYSHAGRNRGGFWGDNGHGGLWREGWRWSWGRRWCRLGAPGNQQEDGHENETGRKYTVLHDLRVDWRTDIIVVNRSRF
jgi:hypothetical protein